MFSKCPTLSDKLSYSHYCELIWNDDFNKINYYISISIIQNLSVRQLREKIKLNEYERLPEDTKNKIINKKDVDVIDYVKNPIIIKNSKNYEIIPEKILQKLILEDIETLMKEFGNSFCFIGSEYKIRMGVQFNYIDLLLFNIEYNCYVVVELKVTEIKKEHIGQIQVYMNCIDKNLRKINQETTIGIIICKQDNKFLIEYCSDDRIISREYEYVNFKKLIVDWSAFFNFPTTFDAIILLIKFISSGIKDIIKTLNKKKILYYSCIKNNKRLFYIF